MELDAEAVFSRIPFARTLGIEVESVEPGHAVGRVDLESMHSSNPERMVAHGGVAYSLADTVGGAAVVALAGSVTPTVDMRIDYLRPATGELLRAEADVVRSGGSVATVDVTVTDGDNEPLAEARGVYKTGGGDGGNAWTGDDGTRTDGEN
jgi:uncharacterized protein (TIGR00369 family)